MKALEFKATHVSGSKPNNTGVPAAGKYDLSSNVVNLTVKPVEEVSTEVEYPPSEVLNYIVTNLLIKGYTVYLVKND